MIDINLQAFRKKADAESFCAQNGTTIKKVVLKNTEDVLAALVKIADKIERGSVVINEDWQKAAAPLNSMITAIANHWYLED